MKYSIYYKPFYEKKIYCHTLSISEMLSRDGLDWKSEKFIIDVPSLIHIRIMLSLIKHKYCGLNWTFHIEENNDE